MTILNFTRHQRREDIFNSLNNFKKTYGFKALDIKNGALVSTVWHDDATVGRHEDFNLAIEELLRQTMNEVLNFYRVIFSQDERGRNPAHYGYLVKMKEAETQLIMDLLVSSTRAISP